MNKKKSDKSAIANKELAYQNDEKEKRVAELILANKELNQSAELLQKNLKGISDYQYALDGSSIIAITDQNGIIKKANSNFCKISKYSEEELIGQDHRIINSGYHTKEFIRDLWVTIANGKTWKGEFKNKAKDGNFYWVDTTDRKEVEESLTQRTAQLETANKELAFQIEENEKRASELIIANKLAIQNEEKEKRAAELIIANKELKQANERFELIGKATNDGLWDWNIETSLVWGNEVHQQMYGLSLADPVPSYEEWKHRIHPEDRERTVKVLEETMASEYNICTTEYRFNTENIGWMNVYGRTLIERNKEGKPVRLIGSMMDITERKKTEKEILRVIERYDMIAKATSDTIWDWDITNDKILYNEGITKMFGYEKAKIENISDWWKTKIHPDDMQIVQEAVAAAFKKQSFNLQLEYRFRCADESFKYIYDRAFIIYDEHKKPCKMIGAMQDVSKLKENEISLIELNANLQKQAKELFISNEILEGQNQLLQDIAWTQSHIVRAPLARMLGIVTIIKDLRVESPDYKEWINHFITSANEFDNIIKDIVDKTATTKLDKF